VLSILLISKFLKERVRRRAHSIDYFGAIALSAGVSFLLLGLQTTDNLPLALSMYAVAAILVPVFVWQERRAAEPIMPLPLFRQRAIGISTLGGLLIGCALYGEQTFLPPFVQGVMGATPTTSGFVLAGASIGWPAASTVGGRLILRLGFRWPCVLGGVILVTGFVLLLFLGPDSPLLAPLAIMTVVGAGFGFYTVATILVAQSAVGWQYRGVVTSATQFSRNIGGTIGVSIAGAIFTSGLLSGLPGGLNPNDLLSAPARAGLSSAELVTLQELLAGSLRTVYILFVGVAAAATLVAAFLPGGPARQVSDTGEPAVDQSDSLAEDAGGVVARS
jgi:predicted MFS family arabinose efflux permease